MLPVGKIVVDFVLVGRIDWYLGETSAKNSNFRRRRPPHSINVNTVRSYVSTL